LEVAEVLLLLEQRFVDAAHRACTRRAYSSPPIAPERNSWPISVSKRSCSLLSKTMPCNGLAALLAASASESPHA
jgi:hypothetical protein